MSLQLVYRKRAAAAWIPAVCLSLVVGGCAWHKVTLKLTPTIGGSVAATEQGSIPLIIDEIRVFQNDAAVNPSLEFTQRLASAVRSAQIFASVYEPTNAHSAPARSAHMCLEVHERSAGPGRFLERGPYRRDLVRADTSTSFAR